MESPEKTRDFLKIMFEIFTPDSIRLKIHKTRKAIKTKTKQTISYYHRFNKLDYQGRKLLYSTLTRNTSKVEELEIVTVAGTIREHSAQYNRKPYASVDFMDMKIDILPSPLKAKQHELQRVRLSKGKLYRDSNNIIKLPLDNLRELWNENPDIKKEEMPNTASAILSIFTKRDSIRDEYKGTSYI